MKKCASCTKDLPDAALHCVFCGAKQPPAPAVQQGLAKTAFGYSPDEAVSPHGRTMLAAQPGPLAAAPPAAAPPMAYAPTMAPQPQPQAYPAPSPTPYQPPRPPPMQPLPPPQPAMPPPAMRPPPAPAGPSYGGGPVAPPGGYVPTSSAGAATMFAAPPAAIPQAQPAALGAPGMAMSGLASPGYGRPGAPSPAAMQPTIVPSAAAAVPAYSPQPAYPPPQQPQIPMMQIPAAQPPPYLSARTPARGSRPIEPWRDTLRMMMFLWGVALLAAFATPLQTEPELLFSWKLLLEGEGIARLPPMILAVVGLLSVLIAAIPMPVAARGLIAALLGLAGVFVPIALVGLPAWRLLAPLVGALLIVPGLLVRSAYRDAALPRILVTLGAIGILAPFVVPEGGAIPLVSVLKGLIDQPGLAKIQPALSLGLIVVVVMSLLAWLPAPVTGGAKLWAWLILMWGFITHVANLVVLDNVPDIITGTPNLALVAWVAGGPGLALGAGYLALVGYGLASVFGKQLE